MRNRFREAGLNVSQGLGAPLARVMYISAADGLVKMASTAMPVFRLPILEPGAVHSPPSWLTRGRPAIDEYRDSRSQREHQRIQEAHRRVRYIYAIYNANFPLRKTVLKHYNMYFVFKPTFHENRQLNN